jgi:hypothetical protein
MVDANVLTECFRWTLILMAFLGACSSMTPPGDGVTDSTIACPPLPVGCRACETAGDCDQAQGQGCVTGCCTTGPCISLGCGADCLNDMDCIEGDICGDNACATPLPDVTCRSSSVCPCSAQCLPRDGGICVPRYFFCEANCPAGVSCSGDDRCASGHCGAAGPGADSTCQ